MEKTATVALWSADADDDEKEENENKNKKKDGLDETMRNKLVTESIAPWRTLRLFLYGSAGSGAFIGGLINGSGAIAASASPDFNIQTELLNLGIDFGAVIAFALLARWDIGQQSELQEVVDKNIERKKELKKINNEMKERESILKSLELDITIGNNDQKRTAKISDLQGGAQQHIIIVAGPRPAIRDALIGANILKMDFAMSNILLVPYDTDTRNKSSKSSSGFGERPSYETQPYVADASGEDWDEYITKEIDFAMQQSKGENADKVGIAIVVANNGEIIRRGVGTVPWRQMVMQLEETVNPKKEEKTGKFEIPLPWID